MNHELSIFNNLKYSKITGLNWIFCVKYPIYKKKIDILIEMYLKHN